MTIGRNGLRPLSSEKHEISVEKELMASYKTGNIVISDENNSKISSIELARLRYHIHDFKRHLFENTIYNDIYKINDIGGVNLLSIENGQNLLENNPKQIAFFNNYVFSFDTDIIINKNNICTFGDSSYINTHFEFKIYNNNVYNVITVDMPLDELSHSIITLDADPDDVTSILLSNITLSYDTTKYITYKMIIHSILFSGS